MNTKNNRKSKMTRKIFQDTMLDLLLTSHITEISVKKLCEEADLNRSTFYSYYENQMDILREIEEEAYEKVQAVMQSGLRQDGKTDSLLIFEQLLTYIRKNDKTFRILLGQNGSRDFQQKLMELTGQTNPVRGADQKADFSGEEYYTRIYRIAGCTRVIENWIKRGFDQPVEDLAKILIQLNAE